MHSVQSGAPDGASSPPARYRSWPARRLASLGPSSIAPAALVLACVVSRLATTIFYVEDPDSLHFALSMIDFDVARLQPHFPGYVVFVAAARLIAALTGSFAVAFSLVGAAATALLVLGLLALARWPLASRRGVIVALVVLGNGMIWLYANRYMPDLLGAALLVWGLHDLTADDERKRVRGGLLAALLAGTRLSSLPFLLPALVYALLRTRRRVALALAFAAGIVVWAAPLIALTGWSDLVTIATTQTAGHFDEFGGTIRTEPNVALRLGRIAEGLWSDALGGFLPGRSPLTLLTGAAAILAIALALPRARRALATRRWQLIATGAVAYVVWIFLYQNVIHHSRHLLPLVPLLALALAVGFERLAESGRTGRAIAVAAIASMALLGGMLAWQHRRPSAIAQVASALRRSDAPLTVVSTGLVNDYLRATGVRARFVAVDQPGVADSLREPIAGRVVSVGDYRTRVPLPASAPVRFFHNPYVNRIWPIVELYDYRTVGGRR